MVCKETFFSDHAISQMFKRGISVNIVKFVIENGEVIIEYPNDRPYPSLLILHFIDTRPLHVVLGKDDEFGKCIVITAYEPDVNLWEAGFKLKRK